MQKTTKHAQIERLICFCIIAKVKAKIIGFSKKAYLSHDNFPLS
jgi:hypothetical protein